MAMLISFKMLVKGCNSIAHSHVDRQKNRQRYRKKDRKREEKKMS